MGLQLTGERCNGCKRAFHTNNLKCVYCGYDYYEEVHNHKRPLNERSLKVQLALEEMLGKDTTA